MKISVFGTGYVGLVTAACFAELGHEVLGADVDEGKILRLEKGEIPIYEPGLEEIVKRNMKERRLRFTTDTVSAVSFGELLFVAVGTPPTDTGEPDMRYVHAVADTIGENLAEDRRIVIMKSTVPVGISPQVRDRIAAKLAARGFDGRTTGGKKMDFEVVSNPEFLKEGDAIKDFMYPDRIVVGVVAPWAREVMADLYAPFVKSGHKILMMDPASAEMAKYAANTFLAARISLMNQLAGIAEVLGADIEQVRQALASDQRIGKHFLYPGVGYGGSCFPKDVTALAATAKKAGVDHSLIAAIEEVNAAQKARFAKKALEALGSARGKKLAVWGLAFKPKTDDMRQAPSVEIIEAFLSAGATVTAYDPVAHAEARKAFGDRIAYAEDMYLALDGAEALVVITEWAQFREPDFQKIGARMARKLIVDGRNIYDPEHMRELGFTYVSIGRPTIG